MLMSMKEDGLRHYSVREILTGRAHPMMYWTFAFVGVGMLLWSFAASL